MDDVRYIQRFENFDKSDVVNLETIDNQNLKEHILRVGKRLDELFEG